MRSSWVCQNILAWKYVILHSKWRNTCFTVWLKFFFQEWWTVEEFHKNCQNDAIFHQIYIFGWFSFHVMRNFQLYRMIREKHQNFEHWENGGGFSKNLKIDFLEKATLKFFYFFDGLSIIWTTYSPNFASGEQCLPIEKKKTFFEKKIKIVNFFKNYRRKE